MNRRWVLPVALALALVAAPAQAHQIGQDVTVWKWGSTHCLRGWAEIGHGVYGDGGAGWQGYTRTSNCTVKEWVPAGDLAVQPILNADKKSGDVCKTYPWSYNSKLAWQITLGIEYHPSPIPCGADWYAATTLTYRWFNGDWAGGGMWSGGWHWFCGCLNKTKEAARQGVTLDQPPPRPVWVRPDMTVDLALAPAAMSQPPGRHG